MRLKLSSNGYVSGTFLKDANGEVIQGIDAILFEVNANSKGNSARLNVAFHRVPLEISAIELHRTGGDPVGTIKYLCGCVRNYFASADGPRDREACPFHGDAISFSQVTAAKKPAPKADNLVQISKTHPPADKEAFGFNVD